MTHATHPDGRDNPNSTLDPALVCLLIVGRFHGLQLNGEQVRHQFGQAERLGVDQLTAALTALGLKARRRQLASNRLDRVVTPAIIQFRDGAFAIVARLADDKVLLQEPGERRSRTLSRDEFEQRWNGVLVEVTGRAGARQSEHAGLGWLKAAVRRHLPVLREVMLASAFVQLFALVTPLVFMLVIDKVLAHRSLATLDVLVFALVVITVFEALLGGLRGYLLAHSTHRLDLELGARLFNKLLSLPMAYFESRQVGDVVSRLRELDALRYFLTGTALTVLLDLVFTVVFLTVMLAFSPALTTVVVAAIPVYFLVSLAITPVLRKRLNMKQEVAAGNHALAVEVVTGIETIKGTATEPHWQRRWQQRQAEFADSAHAGSRLSTLSTHLVAFTGKAVTVTVLYLGAHLVMDGALTVGQLIAFNMLAARVNAPIMRLAQLWQELQQVRLSLRRLADVFDAPGERGFRPDRAGLPAIRGAVRFDHVHFRYRPDTSETLADISFDVKPGEVVGIVGASGSGKTTLAKLMQRFYVPERGRILVDGHDLALADASWLRRQVGVVAQDGVLFNSSVRENIALAEPALSFDAVMAVARLVGAHDFILELPDGYDTVVGERGLKLSGGQRQRLLIARALVTNPRLLILDEASAALDTAAEATIHRNMRRITEGRTVFIIAHRLSTLYHVDRILTLEAGRLVEDGPPRKLITQAGRFQQLHRVQEERHAFV